MAPQTDVRSSRRYISLQRPLVLLLLGFVALNATMVWRVHDPISRGYGDFASFYTAGLLVRSGDAARLYDLSMQWRVQQQFARTVKIRLGPLPYIRPPFEAILFVPFTLLPYKIACWVWMGLKLFIILVLPFFLPRPENSSGLYCSPQNQWLISLAYFPVAFDLLQGQDSILVLLLLVIIIRLLLADRDLLAGAVLALATVKFHLILPLVAILVLSRRVSVLPGFLAVGGALFAASLAMVHWAGILAYPGYLRLLDRNAGLGMVNIQSGMPNLRGISTFIFGERPQSLVGQAVLAILLVFGVVLSARVLRGKNKSLEFAALSFAVTIILVTSYYTNAYDLTLLLPILLVLGPRFVAGEGITGWPRAGFLLAIGTLLFTPLSWLLAIGFGHFRYVGIVLLALAVSLYGAIGRMSRDPCRGDGP
jgi:hypothetical protein